MPKIIFLYNGAETEFEYNGKLTLHKAVSEIKMRSDGAGDIKRYMPDFPCGGNGTCRKCRVTVKSGMNNISDLTESEKKYLTESEIKCGVRFACMCEVQGDVAIELQGSHDIESMRIRTEGMQTQISVPQEKTNLGNAKNKFGVAVDIGTTTIAAYLCDIAQGKIIDTAVSENPQRTYGADVISRINYTIENADGLAILKNLILSAIFSLTKKVCLKNNISQNNICNIVLAGNTVMQHLAIGISPASIAVAPFTASTLFDCEITLEKLLSGTNIKCGICKDAKIYFPPAVASYVGGDISTGVIASDTDLSEKSRLFLDIGTNGEIGFGKKGNMIFCATAAGPAFEGANIKLGVPGIDGAVSKIYLDFDNDTGRAKIAYEVIGSINPTGICGSGIIDITALMLEIGVLDETGRIIDSDETEDIELKDSATERYKDLYNLLDVINGENVFYIDKKFKIYITQRDIREIQLAKAAVCAGIMTMLHYGGETKTVQDIDEVILAGGFGAHIDKKSACKIGLIPAELEEKIIVAGNTAGTGAAAVLMDMDALNRVRNLKSFSRYIELSGDNFFMNEYIDKMMF